MAKQTIYVSAFDEDGAIREAKKACTMPKAIIKSVRYSTPDEFIA